MGLRGKLPTVSTAVRVRASSVVLVFACQRGRCELSGR